MKNTYNHKEIEKKWSAKWFSENLYAAEDFSQKPKKYILAEFPYPSGQGLHCGHVMRYTTPDVLARKYRMNGYNVLYPIGWDAFGLPAENYAVKTGVHPAITTKSAIETFTRQMKELGFSFDWSREVNSTDPSYYKWTQWIFLKLWEEGLAELKEEPIWWCDNLKTILANEEVIKDENGSLVAERDGKSPVERRNLKQWVLKMPEYADKLIEGLNEINFPESVRAAQVNWIGRSEGAEINFEVKDSEHKIKIFTTRLDTIYGATFIVVSPEHPLIDILTTEENKESIDAYKTAAKQKTELERTSLEKIKSGVFTGSYAINPFSKKVIPIWTSDFVVTTYGTGAIMGVPAHDERDYEFAKKFSLEIIQVVKPEDNSEVVLPFINKDGIIINSDKYDGLRVTDAYVNMVERAEEGNFGNRKVNYKLRDWLFSRQRYWGEPIPLIHKENGTVEAIASTNDPESIKKSLPLLLPEVPDYTPSSDATSPLSKNLEWVNTNAEDGSPAKRETNTMPNWAGSCWYFLRYIDPHNDEVFADKNKMEYWLPVDKYFGGSEHTTLHLLYSRFWHKFLYDQGLVPTPEPYAWRMNGGILLGPDGDKMSKSKGNIINPDEKVELYGADALRLYINFMGPYDATIAWSEGGIKACKKFIDDLYYLKTKVRNENNSAQVITAYNKMVKRVGEMIDALKCNTAISEFMIFLNIIKKEQYINKELWLGYLKLIAPFAPFITEELWQTTNQHTEWTTENSIHSQSWPIYDESLIIDETITIGVQINGKLRAQVEVTPDEVEDAVKEKVMIMEEVRKWTDGKEPKKFVYVKGRIVNIVI